MKGHALEVKVGILITLCGGVLAAFIILLGDFGIANGEVLYMDVPTSANLKSGAHVKIAGVRAGKVTKIDYLGGETDSETGKPVYVRVTLTIERDKFVSLREDANIFITSVGVLGEKYVEINPGSPDAERMKAGSIVDGKPPMQLALMTSNVSALLSSLNTILDENKENLGGLIAATADTVKSFKSTSERLEGLLERNESRIDEAVEGVVKIEKEVEKLVASGNNAIGDGEELKAAIKDVRLIAQDLRQNTGPILGNIRSAVSKFKGAGDTAQSLMKNVEKVVGSTAGKMENTFTEVEGVVKDVKVMTQRLKSGKGTIGALLSDTEMYEDIKELVKDLKRHPWKFLWKQ